MDLQELLKKVEEIGKVVEGLTATISDITKKLEGEPEYVKTFKDRLEAIEKKIGENVVPMDVIEANRLKIEDLIRGDEGEKKAKEELVKRLEKAEGILDQVVKGYDGIAKRMGHSKGLTIEKSDDKGNDDDAFTKKLKEGKK